MSNTCFFISHICHIVFFVVYLCFSHNASHELPMFPAVALLTYDVADFQLLNYQFILVYADNLTQLNMQVTSLKHEQEG